METRESAGAGGQKCPNKEPSVRDKVPLQRKWVSEPSAAAKRSTFADPEVKRHSHRESLPCGSGGAAAQQKYAPAGGGGNAGKLLSGAPQDPPGPFAQGFPRYPYQLGQPYPQHPQTERFLSGAKPQPGLEPHAWPFAGQLPSDDLYPVGHPAGHPGHPRGPHKAGGGGFPRQKSPSLPPSSYGQYSQSEPGEEGAYGKKEQKPKKPGKYICHYCGRACAKPSVLKKHIRSHTGERPYPCVPCGFSFKTKSNLYKHRKSHAHAIKAGLVPFSELAASRGTDVDQASSVGEAEVHSDGEQSTDTDEEGVEGSTMLMDKGSPIPQISFEADKSTGGVEPAYADSAEELSLGSMKVPLLIVPKPGGVPSPGMECPPFPDMKGLHHMTGSQAGGHAPDDSPTIRQRLALRLTEKKGQDSESASQSLNLLSPHSKGSTDSGYFSRSESAEQQISPPNTNAKSYEEIMFGRTWYYRPNSRSRQSITVGMAGVMGPVDPSLASLKLSGAILDTGKLAEDHVFLRGDGSVAGDPKHYPTGPCQSSTGLLELPADSGPLIRSNSMPTSSPTNLNVPPGIRVSHSFDEMMTSDDVFYPAGLRRLRRQAAFEHSAHEGHGIEAEGYGHVPKNVASSAALKMGERSPGIPEHTAYSPYGTKVGMTEIATRKRRKQKSVGDEEDSPGHWDSSCSGSVEMMGDYDSRPGSLDGARATQTGKGSLYGSVHSQSDSFDTCASMCSEDIVFPDAEGRKAGAGGNVISVIQHTNSLSRPNSFEKSESFEYQPTDKGPSTQYSADQSDTETFEDALSPEALLRSESMEQQPQSDSELASLSSSSAAASPGQPYHIPHKLVRQSNIQVPEIRVTEEPDKPEKEVEAPTVAKEPEKQQQPPHVVEEFQLPQRSDTLSQMPSEKLPPKKKRLRLADMEHSSGESSFESTCTSLSRSPSQESNLSHSSSFSMSFDRDEGLKSVSPTKQDESALASCDSRCKPSEFLTVPGSGHSSHHQQREMRRSSSEQAPCCGLPAETETRSKSFDYGSLSTNSRQGELYCSASAMKERRRGYLVRQASLSVYPETVVQETPGGPELSIKQESCEQGAWPSPAGQSSSDQLTRSKRGGSSGAGVGPHHQHHQHHQHHHQHLLQQSISEDSLPDEPLYQRSQQHRLQAQGSSSDGEHPGQEVMNQEVLQHQYQGGGSLALLPMQQPAGLFWHQDSSQRHRQQLAQFQTHQQLQTLHIQTPHTLHKQQQQHLHALQQQIHDQQCSDRKPESSSTQTYPSFSSFSSSSSFVSRASSSHSQVFGPLSSKLSLPTSITSSLSLLQPVQPIFATQNLGAQSASLPGILVPVRIQTHMPSYGTVMYTNVSQLFANQGGGVAGQGTSLARLGCDTIPPSGANTGVTKSPIGGGIGGAGFNLSQFLGQAEGAVQLIRTRYHPPWNIPEALPLQPGIQQRLNTGIPLSLTSGTISTTDASSSGMGGSSSKRMLSPASSLELFIETKQQKRVKEERMYGQIVKEMSAVELSGAESGNNVGKGGRDQQGSLKSEDGSVDDSDRMSSSPPASEFPVATKIPVPVRSSAPRLPEAPPAESFTPPLQIVTDSAPNISADARESSEELDVDDNSQRSSSPQSMASSNDGEENDDTNQPVTNKIPVNMLVQVAANQGLSGVAGGTLLLTDLSDAQQFFQFPSLRTTTSVSWCFLNYTKPNNIHTAPHTSVYASWCVSSYNPNPLSLSTKAMLALLRSKQRENTETYTMAAMTPPGSGKLVSSLAWKLRFEQLKPESMHLEVGKLGRKLKGVVSRERSKEEQGGEKETSSSSAKQAATAVEPTRIKIFEGGYKSNEDYVYVRGRGRGKYICEECGIRCKKPSMLKKHIRTHTDVRPYVCKFCNFAFKTKGNLTKHMKSKAHMKKCLELGVSVSSMEDVEAEETDTGEEGQRGCGKSVGGVMAEHQFSDVDDSEEDGDGDEVDDDEEDEDDYDGDSTPKTRSRSTSPQPYGLPSLSITAVAASHSVSQCHPSSSYDPSASDFLGGSNKQPLFGYFTTVPSIQITPQLTAGEQAEREELCQGRQGRQQVVEYQRGQQGGGRRLVPPPSSCMDEDLPLLPSPELLSSPSSCLSSPGLDPRSCSPSPLSRSSSPASRRYLSPRREISPLRPISPKRDHGGGVYRRDLSPRGHLSPMSPLSSRSGSPTGRDYKRDLSPRSRAHSRGLIRPVSPRRGLHHHHHQHNPSHPGQQGSMWSLRQGHQTGQPTQEETGHLEPRRLSSEALMEMEQRQGPLSSSGERDSGSHGNQSSSPPHQVLFSHLPLHSQLQVRSTFPLIPIGGIQMVHSIPTSGHAHNPSGHAHNPSGHAHNPSGHAPLPRSAAQGTPQSSSRLALQKRTSEESSANEAASSCQFTSSSGGRAAAGGGGRAGEPSMSLPRDSPEERMMSSVCVGGGETERQQQEESLQTCTKAIASLCIDSSEEREVAGGGEGGRESCSSFSPDSQQQCLLRLLPPSPSPMSPCSSPHASSSISLSSSSSSQDPSHQRVQHFKGGLEVIQPSHHQPSSPHPSTSSPLSPHPSTSSPLSPRPPAPSPLSPRPPASSPLKEEERERQAAASTNRSKDLSKDPTDRK